MKDKMDKPLTMAQGGGKPSYFVPKRVEKEWNKMLKQLATQPCPNDKWGKQMKGKLQKIKELS